jgi:hypothetical protein
MVTTPAERRSWSLRAVSGSRVQPLAVSPYSLSLARRIASSTEATAMMGRTGPKVSSRMIRIEWSTPVRTVGG